MKLMLSLCLLPEKQGLCVRKQLENRKTQKHLTHQCHNSSFFFVEQLIVKLLSLFSVYKKQPYFLRRWFAETTSVPAHLCNPGVYPGFKGYAVSKLG